MNHIWTQISYSYPYLKADLTERRLLNISQKDTNVGKSQEVCVKKKITDIRADPGFSNRGVLNMLAPSAHHSAESSYHGSRAL